MQLKTTLPYIDLRGRTPMDLLRAYPDKAQAVMAAARNTYGFLSRAGAAVALPAADKISHKWLTRNNNPYRYEIESFADILGMRGIYALNMCYEWGCTSGAWATSPGESVTLMRTLDWKFPELGRHAMIAIQDGKAGEFYNITWPALSGVYTAMAPGRFAASINQAPMRRHGLSLPGDWLKNRMMMKHEHGLPPAHLLRHVFEHAPSYEAAKQLLTKTPLALPVIFTLTGIRPGQGCIIERLENAAEVNELSGSRQINAANHFTSRLNGFGKGWRPRAEDSQGRLRQATSIQMHHLHAEEFGWVQAPVLNRLTRLMVLANAKNGRLMVQGFEGVAPVTELFNLPADYYEERQAI